MTKHGIDVGPCPATGQSLANPDHTHTCVGRHDGGDHFCGECKRWWYQKFTPKNRGRVRPKKRA